MLLPGFDRWRRRAQGHVRIQLRILRAGVLASSVLALPALSGPAAAAEPPVVYTIQATTLSGLGALAAGDLSAGAMMRLLMGGEPSSAARTLELTLEASGQADPGSRAEHRVPEGLGVGAVLPLVAPSAAATDSGSAAPGSPSGQPQGRLLIFRGCGEQAGGQQPQVINLATLLPDQQTMARRLASRGGQRLHPGQPRATKVLGRWPNPESAAAGGAVPSGGSLVGAHTVSGSSTPTIAFTLDSRHDFLNPVQLQITPAGAAWRLRWQPVAGAQGYRAVAAGPGRQEDDLVIWTSSARTWGEDPLQALATLLGGAATGAAAGDEMEVLMPPSQTDCAVSAEARQAMQAGVLTFLAPAAPQRRQAAGAAPAWRVQVERQALHLHPLMENLHGEPARRDG